MKFRDASEIENMYSAVAHIPPKQYNLRYLDAPIYVPPGNIKKALLDFSEIGRILNNEFSLVGGKPYDCSIVDIEILRAGLFGDFELCILSDYDVPFERHIHNNPEKKKVMKKISIVANNYLTLLAPQRDSDILEVSDHEDQVQIDTARNAGCKYIISSDYHFLNQTEKEPIGISPEAFAKMHGISFGWERSLNFVDIPPERPYTSKNSLSFVDFMNPDLIKLARGS